jgi:hypothetical protein
VAVTALSLPGRGDDPGRRRRCSAWLWGTAAGVLCLQLGATLAFLASRFLLRDWVQKRFGDRLRAINAGIAKDGAFYLFTLRLVPVFPFFVINLLMGLTPHQGAPSTGSASSACWPARWCT